jgi:hypothetical protein
MTLIRLSRARPLAWCGPETKRRDGDYLYGLRFCPKRWLDGPGRTRRYHELPRVDRNRPFFKGLGIGKSPSVAERIVSKKHGTCRSLSGVDQGPRSRPQCSRERSENWNRLLPESIPYVDPVPFITHQMAAPGEPFGVDHQLLDDRPPFLDIGLLPCAEALAGCARGKT